MTNRNQVVITHIWEHPVLIYMENDKIYDVLFGEEDNEKIAVGDIYVGKVQNIVSNINAAFVEIKKSVLCYLSLNECRELSNGKKIKCGDELVVQVTKAAVKSKKPVVSLFPEVAGRYVVVSTTSNKQTFSKKIVDEQRCVELKQLLDGFAGEEYGMVLRTNAQTASDEEIVKECQHLLSELHEQMDKSQFLACFSLVRKEDSFYRKYINSCKWEEIDRIITDDNEIYCELHDMCGDIVQLYQDASYPLDKLLGLSSKIEKGLEKRAWLKSGGYLVIEPTEALTVIDVNTGKAIDGKRNKETTFYKINCEAALEAARQIRMRNLSGIILIDFIDMNKKENQFKLMELLRQELAKDKTKTSLVDITKLGLVEITRMKKNRPLSSYCQRKE